MGWMKCSVPGCEDRTSPRHRFPIFDQQVYEEWLTRIGNGQLLSLHPLVVYYGRRVCGRHFSHHCKLPNSTKLKQRSLPTLHLPAFNEEPTADNSIIRLTKRTDEGHDEVAEEHSSVNNSLNDLKSSQPPSERNLSFQRIFDEIAKDYNNTETSTTVEPMEPVDLTTLLNLDYTYLVNETSCVPNDGAISAALNSFDETLLNADVETFLTPMHAVPEAPTVHQISIEPSQ